MGKFFKNLFNPKKPGASGGTGDAGSAEGGSIPGMPQPPPSDTGAAPGDALPADAARQMQG